VDGLLRRAVEPHFPTKELDNWVSSITGALLNTSKDVKEDQSRRGRNRRPLRRRESKTKLANYRRCQQLFTTNKRRLTDTLFNGADANLVDVDPPLEELKNIYSKLWGTSRSTFLPTSEAETRKYLAETFPPITPEEVSKSQ
jgi:hypothetical protein